MSKVRVVGAALCCFVLLSAAALADGDVSLKGVKCVMNPKGAAKASTATEYKGGHVYFCCDHCKAEFTKSPKKFAAAANAQLVATKQAKQVKCPLMGKPCKKELVAKVGGTDVHFCCPGCVKKVKAAKGKKQLELVFGEKAFAKGFEPAKKKKQG